MGWDAMGRMGWNAMGWGAMGCYSALAKQELLLQFGMIWDCTFSGKMRENGEEGWEAGPGCLDEHKAQEMVFSPVCSPRCAHIWTFKKALV